MDLDRRFYGGRLVKLILNYFTRKNTKANHVLGRTGKNPYYILSESGADLAFGGGGGSSFGLWLGSQVY
jgi:hypothetical protein